MILEWNKPQRWFVSSACELYRVAKVVLPRGTIYEAWRVLGDNSSLRIGERASADEAKALADAHEGGRHDGSQ